jgi:uncharacterized protein (DUF1015 family)
MTDVRGFRGLRYNVESVDAGAVTCPPYDVISPEAQAAYHARSPWNVVRVEFGLGPTDRSITPNRYTDAATFLKSCLSDGVLVREDTPAIYLYEHEFTYDDVRRVRRGILLAGRLHDWSDGAVRPHEHTRAGPKADRLALLEATAANTSPLWLIYHDDDGAVASALADAWSRKPDLVSSAEGEVHRLIVVDDPEVVRAVSDAFATRPTYIADGHHRYETAARYRDDRRMRSGHYDADASYEFALWLLVDAADAGLVVRPYHRVIASTGVALDAAIDALRVDADVQAIDPALGVASVTAALGGVDAEIACVLWSRGRAWRVAPRLGGDWKSKLPTGHSAAWLALDVVAIDSLVIRDAFGIEAVAEEAGVSHEVTRLHYTPDAAEAIRRVEMGEADVAILVRPVRVGQVCAVADAGDRMPPKSTYFHPKPATGLVLNLLD